MHGIRQHPDAEDRARRAHRDVRHGIRGGITLLLGVLGLCQAGCNWFPGTDPARPAVYVGDVVMRGGAGHVLVSVAGMPAGGLGAIQMGRVGGEAIQLRDIDPSSVVVEGRNGFVVLAATFTACGGALIAANGAAGLPDGEILELRFAITGPRPEVVVQKDGVALAGGTGLWVGTWVLRSGEDAVYIAR